MALLIFLGTLSVQATNPLKGKIIALDAGHGGDWNGATNEIDGKTITEKDVNLAVVYELKPSDQGFQRIKHYWSDGKVMFEGDWEKGRFDPLSRVRRWLR